MTVVFFFLAPPLLDKGVFVFKKFGMHTRSRSAGNAALAVRELPLPTLLGCRARRLARRARDVPVDGSLNSVANISSSDLGGSIVLIPNLPFPVSKC